MDKKKINVKKTKYSTMALGLLAIFLVGTVLVNILANLVTDRLGLRWDITDNRLYEISDTTKKLLETLPEDIQITVLASEYTYQNTSKYRPIREVLTRYEQMSGGKLSVRYVDPYVNPEIVTRYNETSTQSAANIIFESSKRYKSLTPDDLYDMRTNYSEGTQQQGLQAEQKFSSAIMYCLADNLPKAVRTRGHEEDDLSALNSLLITVNYAQDAVSLVSTDLPEDTALLIINNPKSDFEPSEIAKIEDYLANSGNLIVFYDVTIGKHLPNFELFMEDWGVKPLDLLICDSQWAYTTALAVIPTLNSSHEMTKDVRQSSGEYVIAPGSRAWELVWGNGDVHGFRRATAILSHTNTAYGKSISAGTNINTFSKEDGDISGPFYSGVLVEEVNPNTKSRANVLFLSSGLASDEMLNNDMFLNRKLMINAINFMNEDSDAIIVEARYATSQSLTITTADANFIFWSLCVAIPAAVLVSGGVVWVKRRNR